MGSATSSPTSPKADERRLRQQTLIRHFRSPLPPLIVSTKNGPVEGKRLKLKAEPNQQDGKWVNVFLGLPYAKPPVGDLRFRKPEPLDEPAWSSPLSAKRYKCRSVQRDFLWDRVELGVGKSEDCLYLNVIAPGWKGKEFPDGFAVMVYIHGGGFVMDSAVKYNYPNVARTLVRHDVIVVTLQYRLGFLGYFCTGDGNAKGNYGLWDQMMALKWVKANIASFGGNPNNITVFGQSAGAASADILSLSPLSKDLFQQLILMGGSAETMWAVSSTQQLVDYCRLKALKLGFQRSAQSEEWTPEENEELMRFLRSVPAEKFETTMIGDKIVIEELRIPITPVIDGEILPKSVRELRKESSSRRVIAGVSKHEGLLFLALSLQRANAKFLAYCERRAEELLEKANEAVSSPSEAVTISSFRELYGITDSIRKDKESVQKTCVAIMSDLINNLPLQNYCEKMTRDTGSTVYRYIFEHFNADSSRALNPFLPFVGATHCTELMYIFDVNPFVVPWLRNSSDRQVLDLTTRLWTNFAKFGDPNGNPGMSKSDDNNNDLLEEGEKGVLRTKQFQFDWLPVSIAKPERHLVIRKEPCLHEQLESKRTEKLAPSLEHFIQ